MKPPVISRTGEAWVKLRAHLAARIEKLRDDLEQPGAGEDIRGEIRGLRWIISEVEPSLPEDLPPSAAPGNNGY